MSNEGFDWSAFMKFDEGTAWGRDENGKGKGKATKSVRKPPKKRSQPPNGSLPKARNGNRKQ